jgi:hypothetical protein
MRTENREYREERTNAPVAGPSIEDVEMDDVASNPSGPVRKSIRVRLYTEPRGWRHSCEIDFQRELNGDVNLNVLAKLLHVEKTVRVSNLAFIDTWS